MAGRLTGRVAIVTGAGQGIGRGIAKALAHEGCAVSLVGRTESKLLGVVKELDDVRAATYVCDVGKRDHVETMVEATIAELGGIDIVVNNAQGDVLPSKIESITEEQVLELFRTGPLGSLFLTQATLPALRVRGGSIVNFGSAAAVGGWAGYGAYAMAKEASRALTKVAATELARYGIRVNTICPAALSPSIEQFRDDYPDAFDEWLKKTPLGRIGDAELDIGRAVASLVCDDFAYLTGATLMLDGGLLILP
jgi:NAD(P)-dependent dehydrogenase (short-subunit alcohol dehydrogenase family)